MQIANAGIEKDVGEPGEQTITGSVAIRLIDRVKTEEPRTVDNVITSLDNWIYQSRDIFRRVFEIGVEWKYMRTASELDCCLKRSPFPPVDFVAMHSEPMIVDFPG